MFNKTKINTSTSTGKTNRIIEGTTLHGDINSSTDFRLDGILHGNFTSKSKLVIGPKAIVIGDINCANVDIEGVFEGVLKITGLLSIKSTAKLKGEVFISKLAVEPGALFEANCQMTGASAQPQTLPVEKQ